jgi:peroxiredoxin
MPLLPGDFAPHFKCASTVNPHFNFDTVAGRYVVLSFFASTSDPASERTLSLLIERAGGSFDVTNAIFFGVTVDPADVQRLQQRDAGRISFHDLDLSVSRLYDLVGEASEAGQVSYTTKTFVLDHSLRIIAIIGMGDDAEGHVSKVLAVLDSLPSLGSLTTAAPVLIVPYVFEPEFCRELIAYYERKGGEDSGFMRDVNGKTVGLLDYSHKRRMDCEIDDQRLVRATQERIKRRIVPAIRQAYQFDVTRIERHIVACYDAAQGAHFRAHRDNTTLGTAHRRFAVTINLNAPEYEGGEIWFPEFGPKKFKAPSGAAIVFSCSLLHEVPKVTRGKRYAFLPFLYDDAAAAVRERNRKHLGDLSGAGGGNKKPQQCNATLPAEIPVKRRFEEFVVLDGTRGCGNPDGCQTCLSAPAYELDADNGTAAAPSPAAAARPAE